MKKIIFSKKEIKLIILSILVLTFAFGFDDKRPDFVLSYYVSNLFIILFLVSASLLIIETTLRYLAKRYATTVEYELWGIKRFFFGRYDTLKKKIPLGIIFCILGAFLSRGLFTFALLQNHKLKENQALRSLRKYKHILESEIAIIYSVAPLTAVFLICLAKVFAIPQLALINSVIAIFLIIPFPSSDAMRFLFSAKFLYAFISLFVIISTILLSYTGVIAAIITGVITSSIFLFFSVFKTYK